MRYTEILAIHAFTVPANICVRAQTTAKKEISFSAVFIYLFFFRCALLNLTSLLIIHMLAVPTKYDHICMCTVGMYYTVRIIRYKMNSVYLTRVWCKYRNAARIDRFVRFNYRYLYNIQGRTGTQLAHCSGKIIGPQRKE